MTVIRAKPRRAGRPHRPRRAARGVLLLPMLFAGALYAFTRLPEAQTSPRLQASLAGAALFLLLGTGLVWFRAGGRRLGVEVSLRAQHYLQAAAQAAVFAYWGWYWRPVYDAVPLIAAQLAFAYAFDMLLAWARRDTYTFGFGPFPVIFSINLFLWFKPEWFYLQFCMIALGFAAKDLIRWDKDGRRAHVFNPSSFPLALFSLGLILTGTTSWTLGVEIARTQFNPPHIYALLFLVGLPGQFLFGVTTMTMAAVVTTYLFGLGYLAATGTYFFVDSYIPVAVFLGMHLLFTDPSTSPRSELGRIVFGMLYGLANIVLYAVFREAGVPAFYDKLLPVPILNLSIRWIDRAAQSWLSAVDPARLWSSLTARRRNLAYMTLWTTVFVVLSGVDGVGDHHPGHDVRFWQQACVKNATNGCENLALILDVQCSDGSGWACNEVGALRFHRRVRGAASFLEDFSRSCALAFLAGCQNAVGLTKDAAMKPRQSAPDPADYPILLRTGKGPIPEQAPAEILDRACRENWPRACHNLGAVYLQGQGVPRDAPRALAAFDKACSGGVALACSDLGLIYYSGDGVPADRPRGLDLLKRACDMGSEDACRWHRETGAGN